MKSGKRFIECIDSLKSVYGDSALHRSTGWRVFKSVVDNGEGNMRRGRTSTAEKHMPKIDQLIRDDSRVSVRQLANQTGIKKSTVHNIIKKRLKYRNSGAFWVPHKLTEANKHQRVHVCEGLLERYEAEGEGFMDRIVTMDETWVYFYDPLSKKAARAWKHHDSPRVMESSERSRHKIMMVTFFLTGMVLYSTPSLTKTKQ